MECILGPEVQRQSLGLDDLSTVYMAAQLLGYDKPDPSHLYNLTDAELEAVKKKLLELKPNVRKMWANRWRTDQSFRRVTRSSSPWAGR